MSLPFGVKVVENPEEGNANSAPIKTNIKIKFILSFLISFLPSICIYLIVEYGLLENFIKNI
jgi:predicted secreted protein